MPSDVPRLGSLRRDNFSSHLAYTFKNSRYAPENHLRNVFWYADNKQYKKEQITEGKLGLLKKEILPV